MNENAIREKIHRAVDAYGASAADDPFLAQRILAQSRRKEAPHMKKLSTGAIIFIVLTLLSVTALAVGLTVEEVWQQSFEKMNTTGEIYNLSDETMAEISMEEAIAIARKAIQDKYGTPDAELDAMGVYPTYAARGWDGETDDDPSDWRIYFSSRTNVDLDLDTLDYGPTGEYRVYINAETKEVTYCNWYTNDFWSRAQVIWDCGSYDEVYNEYKGASFFTQTAEQQAYWTAQLKDKGYEVREDSEKYRQLLLSGALQLKFCELDKIADNADPLVAAAWEALQDAFGLDPALMQKYGFVATLPDWETGTDDVCIHYSYELEWDMMEAGFLDLNSDFLFNTSLNLGLYMVSFEPGTTRLSAVTHVLHSETLRQESVTEGSFLARNDWNAADLIALDEAFPRLDRAVKRMHAAGKTNDEIRTVTFAFLHSLGSEMYPSAPEGVEVDAWFSETSEWDALITAPIMSYEDFSRTYGSDRRFWPMEVLISLEPHKYRMPNEGEMSMEEAIQLALDQLIKEKGQSALDDLGDYTLNCQRVSLTGDPNVVDCRWEIYITDNPDNPQNGWKIQFGEWEDQIDVPTIQHLTDMSNG